MKKYKLIFEVSKEKASSFLNKKFIYTVLDSINKSKEKRKLLEERFKKERGKK